VPSCRSSQPRLVVAVACATQMTEPGLPERPKTSTEPIEVPIQSISQLMHAAQAGRYALGYFESWSLESLQGVIDAAERTRSPIIIGFNGEFLSQRANASPDDVPLYGTLGRAAAEQARVPCGFIFNECSDDTWLERAITSGFNLIMPAGTGPTLEDYQRRVKRLAGLAHARNVAIEAEVGELPSEEGPGVQSDPQVAADFVAATGLDLLCVSVGNEEIKLQGRAPLDLARLEAIHKRVGVPLVLHGGSGIEDQSLKDAISLGVKKVNFGTYMKQIYLRAVRGALQSNEPNPHALLGGGGETDVLVVGRTVIRDAVLERIELLGCCGRA
jgi:fructose/tagatose bisphosphate aldolase